MHQLSINNLVGKVRCRFFEPVMRGRQQVQHQGEQAYRLSLLPKEGLRYMLSTKECISVVDMNYHAQQQFYTLEAADLTSVSEWMAKQQQLDGQTPAASADQASQQQAPSLQAGAEPLLQAATLYQQEEPARAAGHREPQPEAPKLPGTYRIAQSLKRAQKAVRRVARKSASPPAPPVVSSV